MRRALSTSIAAGIFGIVATGCSQADPLTVVNPCDRTLSLSMKVDHPTAVEPEPLGTVPARAGRTFEDALVHGADRWVVTINETLEHVTLAKRDLSEGTLVLAAASCR